MARSHVDDRKLLRLLKRFPDALQEPVQKAVSETADAAVATAKTLVPVVSGALRDSIKKYKRQRGFAYEVGSKLRYAHLVELGTAPHNLGGHGHHPGAKRQPFVRPAVDQNRQRHKDNIAKAVNDVIRKAAKDGI